MEEFIPKTSYIKKSDDKIYYYNNVDNNKITMKSEFRIGSITKIFTAVSILVAQQNGLLKIDDCVNKYISKSELNLEGMKIIDILLHKSGLQRDFNKLVPIKKGTDKFVPVKKYKNSTDIVNCSKAKN